MQATRLPPQLLPERSPLGCGGYDLREEIKGSRPLFLAEFLKAGSERKGIPD
jgi:hypothetical protein